jgi:transposase InsO family protein
MKDKDERWALFWCGLLHPVIFGDLEEGERNVILRKISEIEVVFPDGVKRKPSLSTLKRKLKRYEEDGLEGLARKPRSDKGQPRAFPQVVIEKAVELKKAVSKRSAYTINKFLEVQFGTTIPESTLYSYLAQAGATKRKLGLSEAPVRCRFTRNHTHDLWVGDYADGPFVLDGDDMAETHLCGLIDCHSRHFVGGRYYLTETFDTLIDACLSAWDIHGAPLQLYLDNAKVFVSPKLKAACYQIHTEILHRPVRDPAPGGIIERFFKTVQDQFESEVRAGEYLTLSQLNRAFSAWVDVSYHQRVHSETHQTPEERYHQGLRAIRKVDLASVRPFFMEKLQRKVHPDFSDVQVHKLFFKVDPKLRGDTVIVRFDPYGDKQSVLIYSLKEEQLDVGIRHDREKAPQLPRKPRSKKAKETLLDTLIQQHDEKLLKQAKGLDYTKMPKPLPFAEFAKALAHALALPGGLTSLSQRQLEQIHKTYQSCPNITRVLLKEALKSTHDMSLPAILFTLKNLAQRQQQKES